MLGIERASFDLTGERRELVGNGMPRDGDVRQLEFTGKFRQLWRRFRSTQRVGDARFEIQTPPPVGSVGLGFGTIKFCAARATSAAPRMFCDASIAWPRMSKLDAGCRASTAAEGSLMLTGSPSQMSAVCGGAAGFAAQCFASILFFAQVGRRVALEDDLAARLPIVDRQLISRSSGRCRVSALPFDGEFVNLPQVIFAHRFGEPRDLERVVPLQSSVGVVVDRLARTRKEARGRVAVAQDELRVALAALQRDAHPHLADRAARKRVRSTECLRAEDQVDPKRAALANQAIEQQRRLLRNAVFFVKNSWNSSIISRIRGS